jgi:hypothetical protein
MSQGRAEQPGTTTLFGMGPTKKKSASFFLILFQILLKKINLPPFGPSINKQKEKIKNKPVYAVQLFLLTLCWGNSHAEWQQGGDY